MSRRMKTFFSRDLCGLSLWIDRFVARHVAAFVYWIFASTTLLDHELASLLGEAVEAEAVKTYRRMLLEQPEDCLLYTSPSPRDGLLSRMPSSA